MLKYLHVKNLALLKECELDFSKGMNVLTGETGAGKSVMLGSVSLALGAHADKEIIRTGADEALVELVFSMNESTKKVLEDMDISVDGDSVFITRKITPTKNTFKINGETATAKQVKELAGGLIDIHGQHEHQSLLKTERQLAMLDAFGGADVKELLDKTAELSKKYGSLKKEYEEAKALDKDRSREISLLKYEVDEIRDAALTEGEDEELEEEYRRMQSAEKLMALTTETMEFISGEGGADAGSLVSRAIQNMRRVSQIDASAEAMTEKLSEAEALMGDFAIELSKYADSLEFSQEEFARVEERLNTINSLKLRFGQTIPKILKVYEEKASELEKLENYEEYLDDLEGRVDAAKTEYDGAAGELTGLRKKCAENFSEKLKTELLTLNFSNVKFEVAFDTDDEKISSNGKDSIEFMISTNLGEPVRPMRNVSSGGELSRIMLAIKTLLAAKDDIDALIFDEIDTGISGRTAWEVANKLSRLSGRHQIILITHLAQIASMADTHFCIEKTESDGNTFTEIKKLTEEGSIGELARLLGTDEPGEATLENARELKKQADEQKQNRA